MFIVTTLLLIYLFWGRLSNTSIVNTPFDLPHTLPLRGILAILVILCHTIYYYQSYCNFVATDFGLIGAPSVSCFFFLSGYGLMTSMKYKGKNYLQCFFKKRLSKLLIPLLIITNIYWIGLAIIGHFSIHILVQRFLEGSGTTPKSWFVFALSICYILYYAVFKFFSKKHGIFIIWCLVLFLIISTYFLDWSLWSMSLVSFPIGISIAYKENLIRTQLSLIILTLSVIGLLYGVCGCYIYSLPMWWLIFSNSMPIVVYIVFRKLDISNNKVLKWLGQYSYEIYLLHGVVLYFIEMYIKNAFILPFVMTISFALAPYYNKSINYIISKM